MREKPSVPSSPGVKKVIPTPRVHLADPHVTSAAPSVAPPNKKQKTSEPFDLDAPDFNAIELVDQQIGPYGALSMDDVSILHHLNFITSNSVAALSRVVMESPVRATRAFIENAKSEYDRIKSLKDELHAKVIKLELNVEKEKSRATTAEAAANLVEESKAKYKESYTCTYGELLETRERL